MSILGCALRDVREPIWKIPIVFQLLEQCNSVLPSGLFRLVRQEILSVLPPALDGVFEVGMLFTFLC